MMHTQTTVVYTSPKNDVNAGTIEFNQFNKSVLIANFSSVPLTLSNNTKTGGIAYFKISANYAQGDNNFQLDQTKGIEQYDGSPISVGSNIIVTPVAAMGIISDASSKRMAWEAYYPIFTAGKTIMPSGNSIPSTFKAGKSGWNGFPVVNHKGKSTTINKPGYWIFTDLGVFYAHKASPEAPAAGYIPDVPNKTTKYSTGAL